MPEINFDRFVTACQQHPKKVVTGFISTAMGATALLITGLFVLLIAKSVITLPGLNVLSGNTIVTNASGICIILSLLTLVGLVLLALSILDARRENKDDPLPSSSENMPSESLPEKNNPPANTKVKPSVGLSHATLITPHVNKTTPANTNSVKTNPVNSSPPTKMQDPEQEVEKSCLSKVETFDPSDKEDSTPKIDIELCRLLMAKETNREVKDKDLLFMFYKTGNKEAFSLLLQQQVSPNICYEDQKTLLFLASQEQKIDYVSLLLAAGANPNYSDRYLPLHMACSNRDAAITELLLKAGADPNKKDAIQGNQNALQVATSGTDNDTCISLLLKAKADVKVLNEIQEASPLLMYLIDRHRSMQTLLDFFIEDENFTETLLQLKFIGMRFSIKGKLFEGIPVSFALLNLIDSVEEFIQTQPNQSKEVYKKALSFLKETYAHLKDKKYWIKRAQEGLPIFLTPIWPRNGVFAAMVKDAKGQPLFFKANQGDGNENKPGLCIYKYFALSNNEAAVKKLLNMDLTDLERQNGLRQGKNYETLTTEKIKAAQDFFNTELHTLLCLEKDPYYIPKKRQFSGCCSLFAALNAFHSALIYVHLQEEENLTQASANGSNYFKIWNSFDRNRYLQKLEKIEREASETVKKIVDFDEIYKNIIYDLILNNRLSPVKSILAKKPHLVSYETLFNEIYGVLRTWALRLRFLEKNERIEAKLKAYIHTAYGLAISIADDEKKEKALTLLCGILCLCRLDDDLIRKIANQVPLIRL
jgi:hypothetical protein